MLINFFLQIYWLSQVSVYLPINRRWHTASQHLLPPCLSEQRHQCCMHTSNIYLMENPIHSMRWTRIFPMHASTKQAKQWESHEHCLINIFVNYLIRPVMNACFHWKSEYSEKFHQNQNVVIQKNCQCHPAGNPNFWLFVQDKNKHLNGNSKITTFWEVVIIFIHITLRHLMSCPGKHVLINFVWWQAKKNRYAPSSELSELITYYSYNRRSYWLGWLPAFT